MAKGTDKIRAIEAQLQQAKEEAKQEVTDSLEAAKKALKEAQAEYDEVFGSAGKKPRKPRAPNKAKGEAKPVASALSDDELLHAFEGLKQGLHGKDLKPFLNEGRRYNILNKVEEAYGKAKNTQKGNGQAFLEYYRAYKNK